MARKAFSVRSCPDPDTPDTCKLEAPLINVSIDSGPYTIAVDRFSTLQKLISTTAYVRRFIARITSKRSYNKPTPQTSTRLPFAERKLDPNEISAARYQWLIHLQTLIDRRDPNAFKRFAPYRDSQGLWRCGGRLKFSNLPAATKHPILLPSSHPVVDLIILNFHVSCGHGGSNSTSAAVRSEYWIPKLRARVKKILNKCQLCRIWEGKAFKSPEQGQLPEFRIQQSRPFQSTGVDYLGPLVVNDQGSCSKVWICLFTCAATRAIHLEMVNDMTCEEFLLCLRRFIAACGKPDNLISDNAKYFKLSNSVLQSLWNNAVKSQTVTKFLEGKEIRWKFIPEHAPWMGGFYERLIGLVKRCLKKILGRQRLSRIQLRTILHEVAAMLNNRPLLMSDDCNDTILTPSMLLGKRQHVSFPIDTETDDVYTQFAPGLKERMIHGWNRLNDVLKQFWDIWLKQYVTSLREVHQRIMKEHGHVFITPSVGSIVLIGDQLPRSQWRLAKIIELPLSQDGRFRTARLLLPNKSVILRPIRLLYPVEIEATSRYSTPDRTPTVPTTYSEHVDPTEDNQPVVPPIVDQADPISETANDTIR